MIRNRFNAPQDMVSIYDLAKLAGLDAPFLTDNPVLVEILPAVEGGSDVVFRNLPQRSYSTSLQEPFAIIEILAYEAFEWQAREIMKLHNRKNFTEKQRRWARKMGL